MAAERTLTIDPSLTLVSLAKRPDVLAWLDAIIAKALAFKREGRFNSALAMRSALEARDQPDKPGFIRRMWDSERSLPELCRETA